MHRAWFAFGAGPRRCPAEVLSMRMLKVALVNLTKNFTFHSDNSLLSGLETEMKVCGGFSFETELLTKIIHMCMDR
jgi:cytochrome P450